MALDAMPEAASIPTPDINVLVACIHDKIAGFAIMRRGQRLLDAGWNLP
jgi:hypothetical protein